MIKRKIIFGCVLVVLSNLIYSQTDILEKNLNLKPGQYKLKEIIELSTARGINFTYNANSIPLEDSIEIKTEGITLKQVLEILQKTLMIEYQLKDDYIILKKKKPNNKYKVNGTIINSDTKELLIGASVYIKDSRFGELSDNNGNYSLTLHPGSYVLVVSYVGFKTVERTFELNSDIDINVSLIPVENQIEEVRVTKQRNFWGNMEQGRNISSIDSKKIESLNTNNATDILKANIPGVWSTSTSGAPGDHQKVVVRGLNTLFGCIDPLYIINGVTVPMVNLHSMGIADLNIHDIENITVLKDASSTSLYGYQGGNGVIIIDTKKYSKEGNISFSTKFGIQQVPRYLNLMNTKDFLTALDTAKANGVSGIRKFYPDYTKDLESTNWQDVVFQNGYIREYQLSGTGNIMDNKFYISGNYYTHSGIIANSNYNRYTLTANVGRNINKKLSLEVNVRISSQKNKNNLDTYNGNELILEGINKSPLIKSTPDTFYYDPPRKPKADANPNMALRTYFNYPLLNQKEPTDSLIKNTINILDIYTNSISLAAKYSLIDNLFFNASSSVTYRNNRFSSSIKYFYTPADNNFMKTNENYLLFNQQLNLNYHKTFGYNEFTIVSGYRNYADNAYWDLDTIENSSKINNIYLKNSLAIDGKKGSVTRFIQSFAAHINYNYKKKYFISLITNYESLKVDNINIGGNLFPSVAITWDISKEIGINRLNWLNQFNVFVNWGITGNYPLNALAHDFYTNYNYYYYDTIINGKAVSQFANHSLKQEIIDEYNIGTDIHLFHNRIRLTADYYIKNSTNLIIMRDIPLYYGGGRMFKNLGKLKNMGKEFALEADIISTSNFAWTTSIALSSNRQRVISVGEEKQLNYYNSDILIPEFEVKENEEVGVIKGYKYMGVWTEKDAEIQNKIGLDYPYVNAMGDKFLKNNNVYSFELKDSDKVVLGKTLPDYTWHWINSFAYKNFSCEMVWYGVAGVSKYNATKAASFIAATNQNTVSFLQNKRRTLSDSAFYQSSYFVEDASFIRLKQITFSYHMPKKIYNKVRMTISLSFENLFTITQYTGYDPESSIYTDNSFSDFAIDRGAYPIPKSVFITFNFDF